MLGVRLSPQQRLLWSHAGAAAICARGRVRIDGRLDADRLAAALAGVVARHEVLRTTFHGDPRLRYPLQVAALDAAPAWRRVDLAAERDPDAALDALWRAAGSRRFDLERGPLLDVQLVRRSDDRHELVVAAPALVVDRASIALLVRELAAAYAAGGPPPAEEPIQYAQFAEWQNEQPAAAPPASAPVVLPFEGDPGASGDEAAACVEVALAIATDRLTPAILLAAWQLQLARITGRHELALAVAVAGRAHDDLEGVMGPVSRWAPITCRVDAAEPIAELARRAERALADAAALDAPPADADHVGFELEALPPPIAAGDLRWTLDECSTGGGGLKLALSVSRRAGRLRVAVWHDPRRIARPGAAALAAQYAALVEQLAIAVDSSPPAGSLRLVGATERARRVADGLGAAHAAAPPPCLHASFEAHAALRPDAVALVGRDEQLDRRALNERANRVAHHLRRRGVGPGSLVGLFCERSASAIVGLLGILKAGGAYVPLDPRAPGKRVEDQLAQAQLAAVIVHDATRERLPGVAAPVISLDAAELRDELTSDPAPPLHADELASVIFTSGSTGVPKGVAITHRAIARYTAGVCAALGVGGGLSFATVSTLTADLGNTSIFAALATGGCLHVIDYETATDGRGFAAYCERWQLDVLKIVPSHLGALLDAGGPGVLPRRLLVLGGEALPLALVDRIAALGAPCAVANHYGPTETTVGALVLPLAALADRRGCASVPIGRPLPHAEAYVLDDHLEPAPIGAAGYVYLGGAGLARGYLGRPDLTADAFVPHPFAAGARLYRTGDRARYRPDGTIEFIGRADHQLKIRGFRVELGEIEARVREHPAIAAAAVVARDAGASGSSVIAYVVPAAGGGLDESALRAFLRARLPDYMMPAAIVPLRALPLTPNGKLDRRALPSPDLARRPRVAPRTPTEAAIAAAWEGVLGRADISVDDNFFEIGGHSLLAIPLMYRIQQALGRSLSLMSIFEAPTVAGLARIADAQGDAAPSVLVVLRAGGSRPPLFCIDPTGRHVSVYQPIADALGGDPPVIGLDLGPLLVARPSIRELVEQLARAIRAHRPEGPYHLLGWSLGGVLALGVARALEQHGARVAFLGIVDTQPRTELYTGGPLDPVDELAGYVDPDRREQLLALPPGELAALRDQLAAASGEARVIAAARWAQARGFLPPDAPAGAFVDRYALLRDAAVFANDLPRPCVAAPLHVWWSTETLARHGAAPVAWEPYTSGAVATATASGDHLAAVRGPDLAAALCALALRAW